MRAERTWLVPRCGADLALAMKPLLLASRKILFVDRYFDLLDQRCRETLKECLALLPVNGGARVTCEIHCVDYDRRAPVSRIEQEAHRWAGTVIPTGMTVNVFFWNEKPRGEDFHARYLLTDVGGINVESGFSAEGPHQHVKLGLLGPEFCDSLLKAFDRQSTVYDIVGPVLEIRADGAVNRI